MITSSQIVPGFMVKLLDNNKDRYFYSTYVVEELDLKADTVILKRIKNGKIITVPRMLLVVAGKEKTPSK